MSIFIKQLVQRKLKQLTANDLLHYSQQYGFSISQEEARQITNYLKSTNLDPFNSSDRIKMFQSLAKITNEETAHQAQNLLEKLIKSYGLEHLFD